MQSEELLKFVLQVLDDVKAQNIVALDVKHLTSIMDHIVVCSGTSTRHTKAIAEHLMVDTKSKGVIPFGVEGQEYGDWVLVDLGDVVVHVMLPETREFYSLEKLWSTKQPVESVVSN